AFASLRVRARLAACAALGCASANHGGRIMQASEIRRLAEGLLSVALAAARAQMAHFGTGMAVESKADRSPVTAADRQSEEIILAALARVAPGGPVIAEADAAASAPPAIAGTVCLGHP